MIELKGINKQVITSVRKLGNDKYEVVKEITETVSRNDIANQINAYSMQVSDEQGLIKRLTEILKKLDESP